MSSQNAVALIKHRLRKSTRTKHFAYEFPKDEDQLRERSRSVNRHVTIVSIPPTLFNIASQELQTYISARPTIFIYDEEKCEEASCISITDIRAIKNNECLWMDVTNVRDENLLASIGERFKIHPLVLADIESTAQRTKLDVLDDALFLVVKLICPDSSTEKIYIEQISFYLQENILITFQEKSKNIFDPIKNRIRQNKGRIRKCKIDYLFYSLFDKIVDQYMDVLDRVGTKMEGIEDQLLKTLSRDTLETIYDLKREMLIFRGSISPLKEIINRLQKEEETQIIQESTYIFLKDLFDHVVQVNDTIDTYRETLASFIDFYMMLNSNAMNEVMKTLTIISTIFIPLTFIAGVYGMNFDNMPEISWKYGYLVVLICMVSLTLVMLFCFRRKKWF